MNHWHWKTFLFTNNFSSAIMPRMGKLISTAQAAARLGITPPRIQSFIGQGRLPAQRIGRYYAIDEDDLKLVAHRKTGRPRKPTDKAIESQPANETALSAVSESSGSLLLDKKTDAECATNRREAA